MKIEEIKKYYNDLAKNNKSTLPDFNFREIEIETICKYLESSDFVCDIGCGDGFSTVRFHEKCKRIIGVDYSYEMIKKAKKNYPNVTFCLYDVNVPMNSLTTDNNVIVNPHFDKIITERCLINLPSWNQQKKAIENIYHALNDNGVFLMMECFKDGLDKINDIRKILGVKEDKIVTHNRFFIKDEFEEWIVQFFNIVKIEYFGFYHIISRVVHPALVLPNEPKYDAKINDIARKITQVLPDYWSGLGHNVFYILKKN